VTSAPSSVGAQDGGSSAATLIRRGRGRANAVFTLRGAGDLRVAQPDDVLAPRRAAVADLPWTWLRQVHGGEVVVVEDPGQHAGVEADAAVTATPGAALAIHTADCAPVALLSDRAVGAVHAGWRGLAAGVVEATVAALRDLGAGDVRAVLGPCIHAECYEFGEAELGQLAARYGPAVRGTTGDGRPALDVPATVRAALRAAGIADVDQIATCTGCDARFFSHRVRRDTGRQAMVVWLEGG
jgi:purine-nucleoside/S-methyl-5'-thioadenosine phosphorylase / adenosine deaminase